MKTKFKSLGIIAFTAMIVFALTGCRDPQPDPLPSTPILVSISVTTPPTKLSYFVGDTLDITGLVVTASYSDGKTTTTQTVPHSSLDFSHTVLSTVSNSFQITVLHKSDHSKTANFNVQVHDTITVINLANIPGITVPATGATPVGAVGVNAQYSGTVSWAPPIVGGVFAPSTIYTATITLTAIPPNTFTGVAANFFNVAGTTSTTNPVNGNVVTATFPATAMTSPVAADFQVVNQASLTQAATSVSAITVTALPEKTTGTITVLYGDAKSLVVPQLAGVYPIYINVTVAAPFAAVTELLLPSISLTVTNIPITAEHFDAVGAYFMVKDEVSAVAVNWKTAAVWTPSANISVFYRGIDGTTSAKNAVVPQTVGKYEVIVDVNAVTGYIAAVTELRVFTFEVTEEQIVTGSVSLGITVAQFQDPAHVIDSNNLEFSITTPGLRYIELTGLDNYYGFVRWTVNGGTPLTDYHKFLIVNSYMDIGNYPVMVEIYVNGAWYNKTFTFKVNP